MNRSTIVGHVSVGQSATITSDQSESFLSTYLSPISLFTLPLHGYQQIHTSICSVLILCRAAYYAIARELRPYTVGMARKDIKKLDDDSTGAFFSINQELQLWACNSTVEEKKAKIELVSFDLGGGEVDRQTFGGLLKANASTEIWKGDVPGMPLSFLIFPNPPPYQFNTFSIISTAQLGIGSSFSADRV